MVYVLEDDSAVAKSIAWLLQANELDTTLFNHPATFLDNAKVNCPSCLLLDLQMPGMGGLELLKQISLRPELSMPTIILTGSGTVTAAVESMKLGVYDFLEKPIDHEILLQSVRESLACDAVNRDETTRKTALKQRVDRLTDREREILELMSLGNSSKEMAVMLHISIKTVSIHRWHLMKKLQVASATEAVHLAFRAFVDVEERQGRLFRNAGGQRS